jgi:branched-chain amino acid aminotransferase
MSPNIVVCLLSSKASAYQHLDHFDRYESVNAVQQDIPGGVYTTFRTYQRTRVVYLNDHFARLRESAKILGYPILLNPRKIRKIVRKILDEFGFNENRIRLSMDLYTCPGDMYILIEPLKIPGREDYERGARVCTRNLHREKPKAKSTEFVERADKERSSVDPDVNEIIMIGPDGSLLEGLSSNFFAIKDGVVWTEDAAALSGMTRKVVLGIMRDFGIVVNLHGFPAGDINFIEEAFITSASRGVLPVTSIDNRVVFEGTPGPITKMIVQKFDQRINKLLEEI